MLIKEITLDEVFFNYMNDRQPHGFYSLCPKDKMTFYEYCEKLKNQYYVIV
jgi:hypothetical protein